MAQFMAYDRAICGIVFGTFAALAAACAQAGAEPTMASIETTYAQLPARLCLDADAATWQALRSGATRLALHVRHQTASPRNSPTLTIRLAGDAKTRRDIETLTLGIDNVGESGPVPQHFLINLAPVLPAARDGERVCVEVDVDRIDAQDAALGERRVTISADWRATGK